MNPEFYKVITDFLAEYKKEKISVLDIGCAEIRPYSEFLINISTDFTGLDKSKTLIEKALNKIDNKKCKLLLKDVEEMEMPDESFDIIVCNNMLAYTDQEKVLTKIQCLLKKNGICVSFNNNTIDYSLYKIAHPYKVFYKEIPHSLLVILNTWVFRLTGVRLFRTVYNSLTSLTRVLKKLTLHKIEINKVKVDLPYPVINFYFVK
jgi:ubiquinone/menaquinone biosynthesis C-methylase UbiE